MSQPLAGVGVLVTRPREQAQRFMARIVELGGEPWCLPALEIRPPADESAFLRVVGELDSAHWAVFISPTAVDRAWPAIAERGGLPARLRVAAVGQGSARELAARGVPDVLAPVGSSDSESLLALPEFQDMAGKRVVIFRGEGGRELLAETLAARGAEVRAAVCYRRVAPEADPAPVLAAWRAGRIHAVTVFSRDSLDGLAGLLGEEGRALLRSTPLFAPHPRIAEHARALGILGAIATPPGEEGVLNALVEHVAHVHD